MLTTLPLHQAAPAAVAVHPHEMRRRGLTAMLQEVSAVSVAASHAELVAALRGPAADVLVLAIGHGFNEDAMAGGHVPAWVRSAALVAVLDQPDGDLARIAMRFGAGSMLLERDLTVELLDTAINHALGEDYGFLPRELVMGALSLARTPRDPAIALALSRREGEVLDLLVEGLSNRQIGLRLAISEHGVKRHVANILVKLHCPNRTTLATRALVTA